MQRFTVMVSAWNFMFYRSDANTPIGGGGGGGGGGGDDDDGSFQHPL